MYLLVKSIIRSSGAGVYGYVPSNKKCAWERDPLYACHLHVYMKIVLTRHSEFTLTSD